VSRSAQEIEQWIVGRVSALTATSSREIDAHEPMLRYGLDSVAVVGLVADLEAWVGYRFRENPLEAHPTIASLAQFLAEQVSHGERRA